MLASLEEEKDAKNEMLLEENTKAFKRSMNLSPGVLVQKRARNGSTRHLELKFPPPCRPRSFLHHMQSLARK